MMRFIVSLEKAFQENNNSENAFAMAKYMKNKFVFFGIRTTERRQLLKEIWNQNKQEVAFNSRAIALYLFAKQEREFHYCAIEILIKELHEKYTKEDIDFIEKLITTNSWWDSVDTIAKNILENYLLEFPNCIEETILRLSNSENMWLNRSALLFQLGYKDKTNFNLLQSICLRHQSSHVFLFKKQLDGHYASMPKQTPN
jgi:3-methyladenine DNA glycosylase AlkD